MRALTPVRMDKKRLWAARFFKTRALAARACELGRIESNGQHAKASREVQTGDMLRVKNDGGDFQVEVLLLSELRGPAAVAQTLYRETEASRGSVWNWRKLAKQCRAPMAYAKVNHQNATAVNSIGFVAGSDEQRREPPTYPP